MPSDYGDSIDTAETSEIVETTESADAGLSTEGVGALQGESETDEAVDQLSTIEGIQPDVWDAATNDERLDSLRLVEGEMADIQGRPAVPIETYDSTDPGEYGYFDSRSDRMFVSERSLAEDGARENVDTIVHEGRHAYQDYAIGHPGFHPDQAEVDAWRDNQEHYLDARTYGQEAYENQPVEMDARTYAQEVTDGVYGPKSEEL